MRTGLAVIALMLSAAPAAAQVAVQGQYDLACRWDHVVTRDGRATSTLNGIEQVFRVDTNRKAYCEADCSMIWPIHQVTPTSVVFRSGLEYDNLSRMEYRADGTFRRDNGYWTEARVTWGRGTCEKRRFSGFPANATEGIGAD